MVILIWHNTYPIHRTKLGRIARLGENMSSSVHHLHKEMVDRSRNQKRSYGVLVDF
jgi:hypothetical protein